MSNSGAKGLNTFHVSKTCYIPIPIYLFVYVFVVYLTTPQITWAVLATSNGQAICVN